MAASHPVIDSQQRCLLLLLVAVVVVVLCNIAHTNSCRAMCATSAATAEGGAQHWIILLGPADEAFSLPCLASTISSKQLGVWTFHGLRIIFSTSADLLEREAGTSPRNQKPLPLLLAPI